MTTTNAGYLTDTLRDEAVIFLPGDGDVLELAGGRVTLKITSNMTNDQFGLYEITLAPGLTGAKPHYHRFMDETFIVNKGTLTVQVSGREKEVPEGSVIYIPRYTPHGFCNASSGDVTVTLLFNPGQRREGFFKGLLEILAEQPVDPKKFLTLYYKYDSFPVDDNNMLPG